MPTIFKMLDLSTKHLPEGVHDDLNEYEGVIADERDHGWLLRVPRDIESHLDEAFDDFSTLRDQTPPAIIEIWRFAQKHDCQYVLLDEDGAEYDALESYDW